MSFPKSEHLQIGEDSGFYITKKYLGGGAFGSVWKGYHIKNPSHKYAIKKVDMLACTKKGKGAENVELIRNEINALKEFKKIKPKNVVNFVSFVKEPTTNIYYIIMELVKGVQLKNLDKNVIIKNLKPIILQIATGLECMHSRGIVHRDIKPENLILDNVTKQIVIVDLGLACQEKETRRKLEIDKDVKISECSGEAGTKGYKDPIILERGETTCKSDIYSLGISLYRLITGLKPKLALTATSESPSEFRDHIYADFKHDTHVISKLKIPNKIKELINSMLEPLNHKKRPSASDILKILK